MTITLPGLIDIHVHTRDPGQTHKEDWDSATASAIAGGFTTILAMPNTDPVVADAATLAEAKAAARARARCDHALYAGATLANADTVGDLAHRVAGLKMYLDQTFGDLRLDDLEVWWRHLEAWPDHPPLVVHAERASLGAVLLMAGWLERPIHVCHLSRRDELLLVMRARERGVAVTCEVAPHHLFLDTSDADRLGAVAGVKPPLSPPHDRVFLWAHLDQIDCFATDHAPHTLAEKQGPNAPPGFPGLETIVPLLLTAVHDGLLDLDGLVARLHTNPRRIFGLPPTPDAIVEVDPDAAWTIDPARLHSRCGWSPFAGREVRGRVTRVTARGMEMFDGETVLAPPGWGHDVREETA